MTALKFKMATLVFDINKVIAMLPYAIVLPIFTWIVIFIMSLCGADEPDVYEFTEP